MKLVAATVRSVVLVVIFVAVAGTSERCNRNVEVVARIAFTEEASRVGATEREPQLLEVDWRSWSPPPRGLQRVVEQLRGGGCNRT